MDFGIREIMFYRTYMEQHLNKSTEGKKNYLQQQVNESFC